MLQSTQTSTIESFVIMAIDNNAPSYLTDILLKYVPNADNFVNNLNKAFTPTKPDNYSNLLYVEDI